MHDARAHPLTRPGWCWPTAPARCSLLDDDDQRGLAHLLAHLAFNGTRNYPRQELVGPLQRAGVRFGADLNAYPTQTETVYELPLPAADFAKVLAEQRADFARQGTTNAYWLGYLLSQYQSGEPLAARLAQPRLPAALTPADARRYLAPRHLLRCELRPAGAAQ